MNIFLTYDYELFFGEQSGSVEKCMLEPTRDLFRLTQDKEVYLTFFVDVGYLLAAEKYDELSEELTSVKAQIKEMVERGHDVQLHIHPHWEKAKYVKGRWQMNADGAYKLFDFPREERNQIIRSYKSYLEGVTGKQIQAFRAGGWCIQPFDEIADVFKEVGIKIDSSVFPGGVLITENYNVDFLSAPRKSKYSFESDVCVEDENGYFIEYPIAALRYSPMFFWRLYILGRLFPAEHKMVGDGVFLSQGKSRKRKTLTTYTNTHVSTDGYYASKLSAALNKAENLNQNELVIIGHPKGNTQFSLKRLNSFIQVNHKKHSFTTFSRVQ